VQKNIIALKREICEIGRRVYERGYVASNDGNISIRLDDERVLITPSGVSKGFMKPEQMCVIDMEGKLLKGSVKPSSEHKLHLKLYEERPDVNSVCHAHPPYATGFAVAGLPLDQCVLPEVVVALGGIPLADYGLPGTDDIFKPILQYVKDYDAFLLANHGAVTIGPNVLNAYHKMETLEHFAHILFVAKALGQVNVFNQEQVEGLLNLREKFGININAGCAIPAKSDPAITRASRAANPTNAAASEVDKEVLVQRITDAVLKRLSIS
jgi:L-fuculose-phosphate aldolase